MFYYRIVLLEVQESDSYLSTSLVTRGVGEGEPGHMSG